jgi:D-apionolactonase
VLNCRSNNNGSELSREHGSRFTGSAQRPLPLQDYNNSTVSLGSDILNLPKSVLYYGKSEALPNRRMLRAGPLTMLFEEGNLRYVRLRDREVLRRIYVAVRDSNWEMVMPTLSELHFSIKRESFRIAFAAEHRQAEIHFSWRGLIRGSARGEIRYTMEGEAEKDFMTNRIGFCVLHPIDECAGKPVEAVKVNGPNERREFPLLISPHQPLKNLRGTIHEIAPGVWAHVQVDGDIFEMEDQRNWSDASYKTYSRPFDLPWPYLVKKGQKISQSVVLSLSRSGATKPPRLSKDIRLTLDDRAPTALPRLGLCMASHTQGLADSEKSQLMRLNLAHLRVDLNPTKAGWEATLERASHQARSLGVVLEAALFLPEVASKELARLYTELVRTRPPVSAWLILDQNGLSTPGKAARIAREKLLTLNARVSIGGGTNGNFCQINRSHPLVSLLDFVSYSINPQVHSTDNLTLVENLAGQAWTVVSARKFCGEAAIAVGPVTLRPRFQPDAGEELPMSGQLPSQVDQRQMSLFGACWTLGSIKYLSESGADSITYYETTGWGGVMETEKGSPDPKSFKSQPGMLYPMYHVFADVGEMVGGRVIRTTSTEPLKVDALTLRKAEKTIMLVANMSGEKQKVLVPNLGNERVNVRRLNEQTCKAAMFDGEAYRIQRTAVQSTPHETFKLSLLPYELARVDF